MTPCDQLRAKRNEMLPDRYEAMYQHPVDIADVLRMLAVHEDKKYGCTRYSLLMNGMLNDPLRLVCTFDLTKPLSAPENKEACREILKLLDNE